MTELTWDDIAKTPKAKLKAKFKIMPRDKDDDYSIPPKTSLEKQSHAELVEELHHVYSDIAQALIISGLIKASKSSEKVIQMDWWPQMKLILMLLWSNRLS